VTVKREKKAYAYRATARLNLLEKDGYGKPLFSEESTRITANADVKKKRGVEKTGSKGARTVGSRLCQSRVSKRGHWKKALEISPGKKKEEINAQNEGSGSKGVLGTI